MIDFDSILSEKSRFRFYSIFSVFSIEYSVWNQSPKVINTAIYRNHRKSAVV